MKCRCGPRAIVNAIARNHLSRRHRKTVSTDATKKVNPEERRKDAKRTCSPWKSKCKMSLQPSISMVSSGGFVAGTNYYNSDSSLTLTAFPSSPADVFDDYIYKFAF